jgi:hypothetical protein
MVTEFVISTEVRQRRTERRDLVTDVNQFINIDGSFDFTQHDK